MSFDLDRMLALAPLVRVVVAETKGSVPREIGAAMHVCAETVEGTIGGGALEYEAINRARGLFTSKACMVNRMPLGPLLGQCCGGSVTLVSEYWDQPRLSQVQGDLAVRAVQDTDAPMPFKLKKAVSDTRSGKQMSAVRLIDGWLIEPIKRANREIWVWGAGHVGRAIVATLAPLPELRVFWVDTARDRFPEAVPDGIEVMIAENPADLVTVSSAKSEHFVLTYSHALDLELCHRILSQPFQSLGLIGSKTKRGRFRSRLEALGHGQAQISRMICPIGDPSLGKHPHAIALGVAADIVRAGTLGDAMIGETR